MNLYRVGTPSIGEVWVERFNWNRSSGGLGTGVYAFRDREAAVGNIERVSPEKELIVLRNALENPLQPQTRDGTDELVKLSRFMSLLASQHRQGAYTFDDAISDLDDGLLLASLGGMFDDAGFGEGDSLSPIAQRVLLDVPGLGREYSFDTTPFLRDFIEATREAERLRERVDRRKAIQPINVFLYPDFDGVCPADGAGGNTGRHGCVIFKQRIDECVGRETESFEKISPGTLNVCWARDA